MPELLLQLRQWEGRVQPRTVAQEEALGEALPFSKLLEELPLRKRANLPEAQLEGELVYGAAERCQLLLEL